MSNSTGPVRFNSANVNTVFDVLGDDDNNCVLYAWLIYLFPKFQNGNWLGSFIFFAPFSVSFVYYISVLSCRCERLCVCVLQDDYVDRRLLLPSPTEHFGYRVMVKCLELR